MKMATDKQKNLRIRTLWSEGQQGECRVGVLIGGGKGPSAAAPKRSLNEYYVQIRTGLGVVELNERYFLRRFTYVGEATTRKPRL